MHTVQYCKVLWHALLVEATVSSLSHYAIKVKYFVE